MGKRINFIWDEIKAESNLLKHGISFEEAKTAFYDPSARILYDPDHSKPEDRILLLGKSNSLRMIIVCHLYREHGKTIRLISARKATKTERKQYQNFDL